MKEAFWIIDELVAQGVTKFLIAPGSRNTPLVIAAAEHPKAKTMVHFDERGIGFYALGVALGAKKPAVVITTSGTAAGNLLPSVMEAHHSETPMILLTTDRPPELRDCGANQTTDQVKMFSHFVRWQADLTSLTNENYFRSIVAQGLFHAMQNPMGPVQLNCPFREPLYQKQESIPSRVPILFKKSLLVPPPTRTEAKRGIILIGEIGSDPKPILELAARLKWPVFADILSNARLNPTFEQIRHFDWILKTKHGLEPDFILHFGKRFASKKILEWEPTLHVSPSPFLQDPTRSLKMRIQSDIEPLCASFDAGTDPSWLPAWKSKDHSLGATLEKMFQRQNPFTEAHAMRRLEKIIPETSAIFFGNGMPIRDADHFFFPKKCLSFFGNRGLSGIDGNIATACGLSDGLDAPVIAFLGDQTCLHDLNSLSLLTKSRAPITLIVSNNFGGGIFSHLPIADWPHFETFMAASHSWNFEYAAKMFGIPYLSFDQISFEKSCLVELFTTREENFRFQKSLLESL